MGEVTVIPRGEGELIGDAADRRVELLSDVDALHATWSRFGPGRVGAELHVHRRHTDLFYVLEGELTIRLGVEDEPVPVMAGQLARIPPHVVHSFRNGSDADVTFLNMHAPGEEFAEYMRAMRDGREFSYDQWPPPDDGGRPTSEAVIGEPVAEIEAIRIEEIDFGPGEQSPDPGLESLYLLEGELCVTSDGGERNAKPGTWLQFPPGAERSISGAARCLRARTPRPSA